MCVPARACTHVLACMYGNKVLGSNPSVYRRVRDKLWKQKSSCAQFDSYKWIDDISNKLPLLWEQQLHSAAQSSVRIHALSLVYASVMQSVCVGLWAAQLAANGAREHCTAERAIAAAGGACTGRTRHR